MGLLGIFAYLVAQFIRPQDFMSFMLGFPIVDVIAGLTLLIVFMSLIRQKRSIALPQNYFIILFLLVIFLSNIVNNNPEAAVEQFVFFLKSTAIYFMFLFILNSSQQLKWTMSFIVILIVFLALQSIYQSLHGVGFANQPLMPGYKEIRVNWIGMWDGPNVLCLLFVSALPFTLEFTFGSYSLLYRLINLFFMAILSYGVYLTNSRGGFIAFVVVLFFYFWNKIKSKKVYSVIMILLIFFVGIRLVPSRMSDLTMEEESAHQRKWLWEQGLSMAKENPVLGVGKGQFVAHTSEHLIAHNNFVQNMAEMGLVGLFLFVSIIYLSFKGLLVAQRALVKTEKNIDMLSLIRAIFISMIGFNVVTFFVNMEHDILFVWWALCAAALVITKKEIDNVHLDFSLRDARNVFFIMIAIIFIVYLVAVRNII